MRLVELNFRGFRSFTQETTFQFPENPSGLYLIRGNNLVSPRLGGNAAGKSSIFDAVTWALYGKSSRGLIGSKLISWGQLDGYAAVKFNRAGTEYTVKRSVNPNQLTLAEGLAAPLIVEQFVVDKAIGLNYECWLSSGLIGQFGNQFFDLGPTEKLNLFSFVLGLDRWKDSADKASKDVSRLDTLYHSEDRAVAELKGKQNQIDLQIKQLLAAAISYEDKRDGDLDELELQATEQEGLIATMRDNLTAAEQTSVDALNTYNEAVKLSDLYQAAMQDSTSLDQRKQLELIDIDNQIRAATSERSSIAESSPLCPKCKQVVDHDHIAIELERCQRGLYELEDTKATIYTELQAAVGALSEASRAYGNQKFVCQTALTELRAADDVSSGLHSELSYAQAKLVSISEKILSIKGDVNNYEEQATIANEQLLMIRQDKRAKEGGLKNIAQDLLAATYWGSKGFKELRLWLVDEILRELEVESNNTLLQLGLNGWLISYAVEREVKSGNLSRGFNVFITPPGHDDPILLNSYSGGETQRLRIAGTLAIAGLISRRRGIDLRIEIWDEPTSHLNSDGIMDLLQFLKERSMIENKQIFIADHHALEFGGFSGVYTVTKDEKFGSSVRFMI